MINNREIYQMQKDIDYLKANGGGGGNAKSGMMPVEYRVTKSDWDKNLNTGYYEYTLIHQDNLQLKELTLKFYKNNEMVLMAYKYLNNDSVMVFSDTDEDVLIVLHERYIVPETYTGGNVDLSNYYTKQETYNKSEVDLKVEDKATVAQLSELEETVNSMSSFEKDWGSVEANPIEVSQVKSDTTSLATYKGIAGQLVVNTETNEVLVMDGTKYGGHKVKSNIPEETKAQIDKNTQDITDLKNAPTGPETLYNFEQYIKRAITYGADADKPILGGE